MKGIIPSERILSRIYFIRKRKVMLDRDLAGLYGVETSQLKRQVRRNIDRFPDDFMFELTEDEFENLRCQIGTSSWGGTRYNSMAFTEQGVAMLSSVLKSKKAIQVNIQIMRTFIELRKAMISVDSIQREVELLKIKFKTHDSKLNILFKAIEELLNPEVKPVKEIGFKNKE
jgi:hypothetical protein